MKDSPVIIGKKGKCLKCSAASKDGGCKYANAGMDLPCGKKKPDEDIY
ncbi:MAG: hypothetical protein U5L76_03510 [Patescibacteria group bacterium]|nr:hypothetical protein [Patescibacteria group bacterium]